MIIAWQWRNIRSAIGGGISGCGESYQNESVINGICRQSLHGASAVWRRQQRASATQRRLWRHQPGGISAGEKWHPVAALGQRSGGASFSQRSSAGIGYGCQRKLAAANVSAARARIKL